MHKYAVFIGRFQPFHVGHLQLVQQALQEAERLIIVMGSPHSCSSLRNPFTLEERKKIIQLSLSIINPERYIFLSVADSAYNLSDWIDRLETQVNIITQNSLPLLVGHYKDESSFYLSCFPQWPLHAFELQAGGISATEIRNLLFAGEKNKAFAHLPQSCWGYLESWMQGSQYIRLVEEYNYVIGYKKQWESAPYPPIFVTTDALLYINQHILVIRRKQHPGKGLLALPGGFLNPGESLEEGCYRELYEETQINLSKNELALAFSGKQVFDHPLRDSRGRIITHVYFFHLPKSPLPSLEASDDASEAFWIPVNHFYKMESDFFSDHALIIKYFLNTLPTNQNDFQKSMPSEGL